MTQLFKRYRELKGLITFFCLGSLLFLFYSYNISQLMPFYGDIGWFYISARDLLLGKGIPLVGITSSHTWLHQGPLWTYLLSLFLWLGNFDPVAGGYLAVGLGVVTVFFVYYVGKQMFSQRVGVIAAVLYAVSPLVILNSRIPYHTTPIPLFSLLYFLSLYLWIKGRKKFFGFSLFFLALLYNFELATVIFVLPLIIYLSFGVMKKEKFITRFSKLDLVKAGLLGVIPMLPVILYDLNHGFKQTIIYVGWIIYTFVTGFAGLLHLMPTSGHKANILPFIYTSFRSLIFYESGVVAIFLLVISLLFICYKLIKSQDSERKISYSIIVLWLVVTLGILIVNGVASDAYLPQIFPVVFLIPALGIDSLYRFSSKVAYLVIVIIVIFNIRSVIVHNYFMKGGEGISLSTRQIIAQEIINKAGTTPFIIKGRGEGSQFRSFTMPYEYLVWYYGRGIDPLLPYKTFIVAEKDFKVSLSLK